MYRMADKCTEFSKKQQEPKINDGEHKSSVTTDSTASTQVKTAINVDDKNAHNAKSMLSSVGAAEIESPNVALASRTTAHTPSNDTKTKTTPTTATATAAIATGTPNNVISSKTVWNMLFSLFWLLTFIRNQFTKAPCGFIEDDSIAVDGNKKKKSKQQQEEKSQAFFHLLLKAKQKQRETGLC